jgi:small neutral amino acid transporter SnatA (MarC family)
MAIAGAVVLLLIALRMIFPPALPPENPAIAREPLIFPLAIPLVAGPSAISYLILWANQWPEQLGLSAVGVLIAWTFSTIVLTLSGFFARIFGQQVLEAIERLMGLLLVTLAVQMFIDALNL